MEAETRDILRGACAATDRWPRLERMLEPVDLASWFEQVDESPFALSDWIDALLEFDEWLSRQRAASSARPIDSMIGYVHCCTLTMAETLAPPNLAVLVREMLDRYGFDAARDVAPDPDL